MNNSHATAVQPEDRPKLAGESESFIMNFVHLAQVSVNVNARLFALAKDGVTRQFPDRAKSFPDGAI